MRTRTLRAVTWTALALGAALMLGSSIMPADLGVLAAGYAVLVALCAVFLGVGLVVRHRAWRRLGALSGPRAPVPTVLQGRRIF